MPSALLESSLFGFIAGLPVHPLVVHAAVVLLPLSALALILLVLVPRWRAQFGWLTIGGLGIGTAAAFVAKESGEALAATMGMPADHARWGDILVPVSIGLVVVAAGWFWLQQRPTRTGAKSIVTTAAGAVSVLVAIAVIVITVLVGHSGAQAVWAGVPTAQASADPTAAAAAKGYSLDEVAAHATAADCWTAIGGTVYNLTGWEDQHPGGQSTITSLCGTDGTAAFKSQHGSQKKPAAALAGYAIGALAKGRSTAPATSAPATPTSATPKSATPTSASAGHTMVEVKQHAAAASCWSVVDGTVYDLTAWIDRHPGGQRRILAMCGKDGTASFRAEHGSQKKANQVLAGYAIGTMG